MAMPSSKSCQNPNPTRHSPGSRSSEVGNPMRRSFSGNPFSKPAIVPNSRGFNPVTPANSPSEYPRSLSVGRESLTSFRGHEDKENGKDQSTKQARIKSVAPFKSPKNFMSPTISAASKFSASPKKRILTDRNEPVRTSVTLSDSRSSCSSVSEALEESNSKLEMETGKAAVADSCDSTVADLEQADANHEVSSLSKGSRKKVAFDANVQTILLDDSETSDCVDVNEDLKTSPAPRSPCHLLAPLDADPLMPPYDPKFNYLSPRPQFLHYKPSPRRTHYLCDEKDGNPLDDTFCIGGFSDTDLTEETQSDDSLKEPEAVSSSEMEKAADSDETEDVSTSEMAKEADGDGEVLVDEEFETIANAAGSDTDLTEETQSDDSLKGPEAVSSSKMEKAADGDETEDVSTSEMAKEADGDGEVLVDEEFETIANAAGFEMGKEAAEVKKVSKHRFFTKTKCISLVFGLLVVACMAMAGANSPLRSCSYIKGSRFNELLETSKLTGSVRVDFDEFAQNFWYLYGDSLSYISELIDHLKGDKQVRGFSYYNLTDLQEDLWIEKNICDGSMIEATPLFEQHDGEVAAARKMVSEEVDKTGSFIELEEGDGLMMIEGALVVEQQDAEVVTGQEVAEDGEETSSITELEEGDGFQIDDDLMMTEGALVVEQHDAEVVTGQEVAEDGEEETSSITELEEGDGLMMIEGAVVVEQHDAGVVAGQEVSEDGEEKHKLELEDFDLRSEVTEPEFPEEGQFQEIVVVTTEFKGENYVSNCDESESDGKTVIGSENIEAVDVAMNSQSNVSLFVMAGLALVGLSLPAAAAFFYVKKGSSSMRVPTPVEQPRATKKFNISPVSASVDQTMWQRWSYPDSPAEVDIAGEPCPSEMSSFQKKSSLGTGLRGANDEAQSQGRGLKQNCRRESLASSSSELSMGSHSYGSFTTYEKIACKHRNGDEEVVITPIRRSSRLLKQLTSP